MYEKVSGRSSDALVTQYAPLVKRIAHHLLARLHDSVQLDDLIQAGMIGLLEAAGKYDAGKGASFETYAGIRIRGAMLDEMRRGDWVPRSVHREARRIADAIHAVEARTGHDASDSEIAAELQVSIDHYHELLRDASTGKLFSSDELGDQLDAATDPDAADASPAGEIEQLQFRQRLAHAIGQLPERERLVLSLYYDEELNLKEIGRVLDVSESRVSQIHSQAAIRLRARLSEWRDTALSS